VCCSFSRCGYAAATAIAGPNATVTSVKELTDDGEIERFSQVNHPTEEIGNVIPEEIVMKDAEVINHRIVMSPDSGRRYVEYEIKVSCKNYGDVTCWKRYSTFRNLCTRLRKEKGYKRSEIPELPKRQVIGNFSKKTIDERKEKLNEFLHTAARMPHLQWGITIDEDISVYKRRVKQQPSQNQRDSVAVENPRMSTSQA